MECQALPLAAQCIAGSSANIPHKDWCGSMTPATMPIHSHSDQIRPDMGRAVLAGTQLLGEEIALITDDDALWSTTVRNGPTSCVLILSHYNIQLTSYLFTPQPLRLERYCCCLGRLGTPCTLRTWSLFIDCLYHLVIL